MDANGLRFALLADADHWRLPGAPPALEYDRRRRALRLARQRRHFALQEDAAEAAARLERVPGTRDRAGNRADYDPEWHRVVTRRGAEEARPLYRLPLAGAVSDLCLGHDGILYLTVGGRVLIHDLRERYDDASVSAEGFAAWRLAAAPEGGVWVLDREGRRLARLRGRPPRRRRAPPRPDGRPSPCAPGTPPHLRLQAEAVWPEGETPVALACSAAGEPACLSWAAEGDALLRRWDPADPARWREPLRLHGARRPYTLAWIGDDQVAVLVHGQVPDTPPEVRSEARVYRLGGGGGDRFPVGDLYPLKPDYDGGPFLHGLDEPPHYPAHRGSHPLVPISRPSFLRRGRGEAPPQRLDSGTPGSVWHRLYLEAVLPAGCGVRLWLAAAERPLAHDDPALEWHEHRVGDCGAEGEGVPQAAWVPHPSELPHHPGLLPCDPEPGRRGLFTLLVQRSGRQVRALRGRYLHLRLELCGPGNATPELFALRAYAGRFSYVERYLPELYHETLLPPEADAPGPATGPDFLERYLDNMEGVLTLLEDRVAHADLLTRPETVPARSLEWLAGWIGLQCEAGWSEAQQRRFLARAAELQRWHGTLRGLELALEIASDGAVSRGGIRVLEDFRLRRTFATLLGVDLDDRDDPLTLGGMESGNAFLGDSLFLGDPEREEFLALFGADLALDADEARAVDAFFDRLAFRVTILVHEEADPELLGMIRRIAEREVPAHVAFRVLTASAPLLVGLTGLVGVDTWLAERAVPGPVQVQRSRVGRGDRLADPPLLDPGRGPASAPPTARGRDLAVPPGQDFTLDAGESEAAEGRRLVAYRWSFLQPGPPAGGGHHPGETT